MNREALTATLAQQFVIFYKGIHRVAQKVGEEAVEVVVAALAQDPNALINESADLLYHLLVLLSARSVSLEKVHQNPSSAGYISLRLS